MNIRQAQRLSSISTAARESSDGGLLVWTAGGIPLRITGDGELLLDYTALHHIHFEDDWQPIHPTPEGQRLLASGERVPRYDLIDHIRQQISDGTYVTPARLDVAFRRMLSE